MGRNHADRKGVEGRRRGGKTAPIQSRAWPKVATIVDHEEEIDQQNMRPEGIRDATGSDRTLRWQDLTIGRDRHSAGAALLGAIDCGRDATRSDRTLW